MPAFSSRHRRAAAFRVFDRPGFFYLYAVALFTERFEVDLKRALYFAPALL
jgi:hypothetical protein